MDVENYRNYCFEAPDVRARVQADPNAFLASYPDGMVIDEVQRVPDLVSYIQVVVDAQVGNGRLILTGSQQFEIMNKVTQSLAGRVGILKLLPFSIAELQAAREAGTANLDVLMFTGFYPRIYDQGIPASQAFSDYFATYVQQDVRSLASVVDLSQFEKFVRICAGRVGQLLNLQNISEDLGIAHATAQRWLTILLENLVMMETLKFRLNRGLRDNLYVYRDSDASEVDLVFEFANGIYPIEVKSGATFTSEYLKGLRHLAKIFEVNSDPLPNGGAVVFAGKQLWTQSGVRVTSYEQMHQLFEDCNRADF